MENEPVITLYQFYTIYCTPLFITFTNVFNGTRLTSAPKPSKKKRIIQIPLKQRSIRHKPGSPRSYPMTKENLRWRRSSRHPVLSIIPLPLLIHLPLANLFRPNPRHTPDERAMTGQRLCNRSLVRVQVSAGFAEEKGVL